jgi:hypothetical protein
MIGSRWARTNFTILDTGTRYYILKMIATIKTLPEADNDELSILCSLLDIVCHNGHVLEVQGGVNFIHHVERCRLNISQIKYCIQLVCRVD